ncbi:hypothetical protein [Microscilla marina]|uniref:Outer membrane protein beta-barrel domain-containing protein n=1 Tax=Microscilla marina ATCC 23134 TaxID=313606 RepID=A1ZIC5_MICM2|nr:hypothetical protein [Microscilla marina]EAY29793.1 hypothetical protein M23134_05665 [Microscilla marina ATCC 23134]
MKSIRLIIIALVFICTIQQTQAQWGIRGGYTYQYNSFAEVGVSLITKKIKPSHDFITLNFPERVSSAFLTTEFNFRKEFVLGGKFGYEVAWVRGVPLTARLSYAYYTNLIEQDMRVIPEVGFNLFGVVHLTYGYNIPLQTFEFEGVSRSRVSLIIVAELGTH